MSIPQIVQRARELEARVIRAGSATERDVAEARELVNKYIDELERLERTATVRVKTVIINADYTITEVLDE